MKKVILEKRGCNFCKGDKIAEVSDVGNYRLTTTERLKGKDGRLYFIEFTNAQIRKVRYTHKITGAPLKHYKVDIINPYGLHISTQYESDGERGLAYGNLKLNESVYEMALDYTRENILKVINYITGANYDTLEIID